MTERKPRRVSLIGPLLLIGIGIVLLLNTLGIVEWSIWWTLLRLWPILIIAAGLDLLLGRYSIWGPLLAALLVVGVAVGALWLSERNVLGGRGVQGQEVRQPLEGTTEATVVIEPGIGTLRIEALPESAILVQGTVALDENEELEEAYTTEGGKATYELRSQQHEWGPFFPDFGDRRTWDLGLSPAPVLELRANLGLGEARLDLTDLRLGDLQTEMGLGFTEVTLPSEGRFQARIDSAIGQMVVIIPENMAARVSVDSGLTVRLMPEGYQKVGDVYTSPGYETADERVELHVSQAIGVLEVHDRE
jgi:hypothetical protein